MRLRTIRNDPRERRVRLYPISKMGPVKALTVIRRKPCTEPIQDIAEGEWERKMTT
jgi:hypothetical protein